MAFCSKREKRLWLAAGLCLLLIYFSVPIARPITEWLRTRDLLRLAVSASFVTSGVIALWALLRRRPGWRVSITAIAIAGAYAFLLVGIDLLPEERLHFLEYGIFAGFVYQALRERRRSACEVGRSPGRRALPPAAGAVLVTAAAGWLDEGIQAVLPTRFYDLRDVAFNALGGILAVSAMKLIEYSRGWGRN